MLLLYDAPEQINRPAAPALDLVKAVQPRGRSLTKSARAASTESEGSFSAALSMSSTARFLATSESLKSRTSDRRNFAIS